jgi:hypothetical protein
VLASFPSALAALHFAVGVKEAMKGAPWSDTLLQQPLAEEVAILSPGAWVERHTVHGAPDERPSVLFRGPRIKAGLDTGHAKAEVHATWRTIMYRGKVMNRASRVCGKAASDQVWGVCSTACLHESTGGWINREPSMCKAKLDFGAEISCAMEKPQTPSMNSVDLHAGVVMPALNSRCLFLVSAEGPPCSPTPWPWLLSAWQPAFPLEPRLPASGVLYS